MDDLSQRTARGLALAALAVAVVVVGPVPRLTQAFERTYAVAVIASERETRAARWRVPTLAWRRRDRPSRSRPLHPRP